MPAGVKPGIYREPVNGHTVEYFEGADVVPGGYEWIGTSEDYASGSIPEFKPVDRWENSRSTQPELTTEPTVPPAVAPGEKAKTTAENKARTGGAPAKGA